MSIGHVTLEELHLFLDGHASSDQKEKVEGHLRGCSECRQMMEESRVVEAAARALPLDSTGAAFTSQTLAKIGRRQHESVVYRILLSLAPAIGVLFVVGVIATAVVLVADSDSVTGPTSRPAVLQTIDQGSRVATGILHQGIEFMQRLFPFLRESSSGMLSLMVVVSFLVLAAADRLVFRRPLERS